LARRRATDQTRRLRADRLEKYARDADRSTRDASVPKPPDVAVSVGYVDEDAAASARSTLPDTATRGLVTPGAVPILHVTPGDAAWFDLHLDVQLVLSAADGEATVEKIAEKLGLPLDRVVAMLTTLMEQKLVRLR
jgi:hypothetical protein